jgi:UDP-N-acetylmuramate--alanine ligase
LPADARWLVRSAAVPSDDPQVRLAEQRGIPCIKYAEALGRLCPAHRTLAVAGTHGKTSTSWLALHALRGVAPGAGALIGGTCSVLGTNALPPAPDDWFVVEACEYDRSFFHLTPHAAAITNLEADHLDCYGTLENLVAAFAQFASQVEPEGLLVLGRNVPLEVERAAGCRVWREGRELHVTARGHEQGLHRFELETPLGRLGPVALAVPGPFQVSNAALALALGAHAAKGADERLAAGIAGFRGAGRRFEFWGDVGGRALVHDYAHHPTELAATLDTAREVFPGRPLEVLFQPHQHGRTRRCLEGFARCLAAFDRAVVTDVYGARRPEAGEPSASAEDLVARATELGGRVELGGPPRAAARRFAAGMAEGAAGLVIGAGNIEEVRDDLHHELSLRAPAPGVPRR